MPNELKLVLADRWRDADLFASFSCWDGSDTSLWASEVQFYVQAGVLAEAEHTLKWIVDGELAGVIGFDSARMPLPLIRPDHDEPVWFIRVAALASLFQAAGRSAALFTEAFRVMRLLDNARDFAYGRVHPDNQWSFKACAKVGLAKLHQWDDGYWTVFGPVA